MKARRIRLSAGLDRYSLREKAVEHGRRVQSSIQKRLPASGDELGKHIEKRITSSHKVWQNAGIAFFSQKSLENVSHFSSISLGILMLILTDIILIFPTDKKALALGPLLTNFFAVLAGLLLINLIVYAAMNFLGSNTKFKVFFSTANTALFMSLLVVSLPAALVSFALFSTMIRSQAAVSMFFSLIPFYNYLIYGWSAESLARLKGIRSVIVALVALVLVLFLNLILMQFSA
jgi:hypothetical protein